MKILTVLNVAIYLAGISVGVIIGMAYEKRWGKKEDPKTQKPAEIPDLDKIVIRLWEKLKR